MQDQVFTNKQLPYSTKKEEEDFIALGKVTSEKYLTQNPSKFMIKLLKALKLAVENNLFQQLWNVFTFHIHIFAYPKVQNIKQEVLGLIDQIEELENSNQQPNEPQAKDLEKKKSELEQEKKKLERKMQSESIGVEHFWREIFHIWVQMDKKSKTIENVSKNNVMSAIQCAMMTGFPIEIIDGDSNSINEHFLEKFFTELPSDIAKSRVLFVSILGHQSSYKSTVMNSLFNSQFSMGQGKCTRGVQISLHKCSHTSKYDYIVACDVEGLESVEMEINKNSSFNSFFYNHRLALVSIYLSHLVLISSKGEVDATLTGTLEVCIYAMAMLKKTLSHPSFCVVSNNCTDTKQDALLHNDKIKQLLVRGVSKFNEHFNEDVQLSDLVPSRECMYLTPAFEPETKNFTRSYSYRVRKLLDYILTIPTHPDFSNFGSWVTNLLRAWESLRAHDFALCYKDLTELENFQQLKNIGKEYESSVALELEQLVLKYRTENVDYLEVIAKIEELAFQVFENYKEKIKEDKFMLWKDKFTINFDNFKNDYITKKKAEMKVVQAFKNTTNQVGDAIQQVNRKIKEEYQLLKQMSEKEREERINTYWMESRANIQKVSEDFKKRIEEMEYEYRGLVRRYWIETNLSCQALSKEDVDVDEKAYILLVKVSKEQFRTLFDQIGLEISKRGRFSIYEFGDMSTHLSNLYNGWCGKNHLEPCIERRKKVFGYCINPLLQQYTKKETEFVNENDPLIKYDNTKPVFIATANTSFKDIVDDFDNAKNIAKKLYDLIQSIAIDSCYLKIYNYLENSLLLSNLEFDSAKLAKENNLLGAKLYFTNIELFAKNYLVKEQEKIISQNIQDLLQEMNTVIGNHVRFLNEIISNSEPSNAQDLYEKIKQQSSSTKYANLGSEFTVILFKDCSTIGGKISQELTSLKEKSPITTIPVFEFDDLLKRKIGCTHQCPCCGAKCAHGYGHSENHSTIVHHFCSFRRVCEKHSQEACLELCTEQKPGTLWNDIPWSEYVTKGDMANWDVKYDQASTRSARMWVKKMWSVLGEEFCKEYRMKFKTDPSWADITWESLNIN